jgi:hypothetical protein
MTKTKAAVVRAVPCDGDCPKAVAGQRLNKHPTRRHRLEATRLALSIRTIQGLAQVQEPGCTRRGARGGRGLGEMAACIFANNASKIR